MPAPPFLSTVEGGGAGINKKVTDTKRDTRGVTTDLVTDRGHPMTKIVVDPKTSLTQGTQ